LDQPRKNDNRKQHASGLFPNLATKREYGKIWPVIKVGEFAGGKNGNGVSAFYAFQIPVRVDRDGGWLRSMRIR
jgi:hypothetical protein